MKKTYWIWESTENTTQWVEITGKQFYELVTSSAGKGRYFMDFDDYKIEVSQEQYRKWKLETNHSNYLKSFEDEVVILSLEWFSKDDDFNHSELLADLSVNVENEVINKIELQRLAEHILKAISQRTVSLSEAEVGTGKTHAYLIAAALAKRGRLNDFWLRGHYDQSYTASAYMPVVISTSSIALQNAIVKDYIPQISRILMAHDIIKKQLSCVIRKGKEHYVCEKNLRAYFADADERTKLVLKPLLAKNSTIDIAEARVVTSYMKSKISVAGRCEENCPHYEECRYLKHMKNVQSSEHDFQVCNHNYFLADVVRRSKGQGNLIPHYQAVIIDEGHKFLQAARQMYGVALSSTAIAQITNDLRSFTFQKGESNDEIQKLAAKLSGQNKRLFKQLNNNIPLSDDDETERYKTVMDSESSRYLRNLRFISEWIVLELSHKTVINRYQGRCAQILWELASIIERVAILQKHDDLVYWLEKPNNCQVEQDVACETVICSIPKRLNDMLYTDLWGENIPIVLTSGTLSAGGSFEHIKRNMGLSKVRGLMETSKPSPFNHKENALLYISETMPFPNNKDRQYIMAVADETECLIKASHGHSAVLFTSYKAMDMVFEILENRNLGFPLFRLDRGGANSEEKRG